ncbi:hypothetical protein HZH68_007599 [Vespula germanica]|uniref:Uncharacterized protein n=1 Tax=Vespula germanica TaxID=30212 RepID=A0A834NB90_VESGE|nr:hypothetical protein HZH68_007599 [Vespula germanica]
MMLEMESYHNRRSSGFLFPLLNLITLVDYLEHVPKLSRYYPDQILTNKVSCSSLMMVSESGATKERTRDQHARTLRLAHYRLIELQTCRTNYIRRYFTSCEFQCQHQKPMLAES